MATYTLCFLVLIIGGTFEEYEWTGASGVHEHWTKIKSYCVGKVRSIECLFK